MPSLLFDCSPAAFLYTVRDDPGIEASIVHLLVFILGNWATVYVPSFKPSQTLEKLLAASIGRDPWHINICILGWCCISFLMHTTMTNLKYCIRRSSSNPGLGDLFYF